MSFELEWLHGLLSLLDYDTPKRSLRLGGSLFTWKGVISAGHDLADAETVGTNRQSSCHRALASS